MTIHPTFGQPVVGLGRGHAGANITPPTFHPAGSEIYGQGQAAVELYRVEFGAVRLYRLLADGRRQISAFHLPGDVFGFESDGSHHFFAETIVASGIRTLRRPRDQGIDAELMAAALQGLVRAQEHLLVLGRQHAAERIAAFLVDMSERQGGLTLVDLPMSRTDIGDYLGLTIETVSRVLTRLKSKGVIRLPNIRSVEIVKPAALRELAC